MSIAVRERLFIGASAGLRLGGSAYALTLMRRYAASVMIGP
jgi:hypothetical protein